ncbi:hypothetical protein ABBQ32_14203 [Trebouxia sp. C0010 RCD-2024]
MLLSGERLHCHACLNPRRSKSKQPAARQLISCSGNGASKHTTIHKLIEQNKTLLIPGVHDALSAKVLAHTGHVSAFVSGYAVSATLLGEPDVGLLTPPEMARKTSQICMSIPQIPVIVDADTGGGNVLNVQRTIKQFIAAGAKGCTLEDQKWPKKSGSVRGKEVIGMDEHIAKVAAAREAIGDADFFLIARTDARATSSKRGLDEAINRANIYLEAGADASYIEGPRSIEELKIIGQRQKGLRASSMIYGSTTPLQSVGELSDMGYHLVFRPLSALYAATKTLIDTYAQMLDAGKVTDLEQLLTFDQFNALVGMEDKLQYEEKYGRGEGQEKLHVKVPGLSRPI